MALLFAAIPFSTQAQAPAAAPAAPATEKKEPAAPYTIELLETRVRFEADGNSRKEVHTRVKINSEFGARPFARLNFDYNRSFEKIEIPFVRITHSSGGIAEILPGAITDNPNPAVVNAPAYQDVRIKSVRILGLAPGDSLEYRVITTVTHPPLAPDVWLEYTFDRTGIVSREIFELDLPASRLADSPTSRRIEMRVNPATPATVSQITADDGSIRSFYHWQPSLPKSDVADKENGSAQLQGPDVALSSFIVWGPLSQRLAELFQMPAEKTPPAPDQAAADKATGLTKSAANPREKLVALYDFVSHGITTVNLPLEATGFRTRPPAEILSSGYATPTDKFVLLASLATSLNLQLETALAGTSPDLKSQLPRPSLFTRILTIWGSLTWCDPSLEVAPFGLLPPGLRGKTAFRVFIPPASNPLADVGDTFFFTIPVELPFPSFQKVHVDGTLGEDGKLSAKVRYALRGDNELLLRVAFHHTPKERWNELAQMLSLADGFRGQIMSITASDPAETHEPFTLEYEIAQPKFVDWSKSSVHIPALLPQAGLPELPENGAAGAAIELGTPLEVETDSTIHLPSSKPFGAAAWSARKPLGMSVTRDYAAFASHYSLADATAEAGGGRTLNSSRHLTFLLRQIAGTRAADYASFVRAVQNDEAQAFTLERAAAAPAAPSPAGKKAAPHKPGTAARPAKP